MATFITRPFGPFQNSVYLDFRDGLNGCNRTRTEYSALVCGIEME